MHIKDFQIEMVLVVISSLLLGLGKIDTNMWWIAISMCLAAVAGSRVPRSHTPPQSLPSNPSDGQPPTISQASAKVSDTITNNGMLMPLIIMASETITQYFRTKNGG